AGLLHRRARVRRRHRKSRRGGAPARHIPLSVAGAGQTSGNWLRRPPARAATAATRVSLRDRGLADSGVYAVRRFATSAVRSSGAPWKPPSIGGPPISFSLTKRSKSAFSFH